MINGKLTHKKGRRGKHLKLCVSTAKVRDILMDSSALSAFKFASFTI